MIINEQLKVLKDRDILFTFDDSEKLNENRTK